MTEQSQLVVQPMQWMNIKDIQEVEPLSSRDEAVMRELREVLIKHNAVDRFGVTLIHKHFDLSSDEEMVEFTDVQARTLTIRPLTGVLKINTIETSWKFSKDTEVGKPLAICNFRCYFDPNSTPQHVGRHVGW